MLNRPTLYPRYPEADRSFVTDRPRWLKRGYAYVAGGPIHMAGYYLDPFCHPMCCRPVGPFKTEQDAAIWVRWTTGPLKRQRLLRRPRFYAHQLEAPYYTDGAGLAFLRRWRPRPKGPSRPYILGRPLVCLE